MEEWEQEERERRGVEQEVKQKERMSDGEL